jgi:hypothetical protein
VVEVGPKLSDQTVRREGDPGCSRPLDQQLSATAIVLVGWSPGVTPAQAESSTKAARKARDLVIYSFHVLVR